MSEFCKIKDEIKEFNYEPINHVKPYLVENKMVISGNIYELYQYEKGVLRGYEDTRRGEVRGRAGQDQTTEDEKKENRAKVLNRARTNVRRLINSNADSLTKFITLTFAENLQDVREANKHYTDFIKRLKYYLKKNKKDNLKYITVVEFQERGAVHYHMLSNVSYIPNKVLNEIWTHGFVKINRIDRVDNLGAYVTKYMSKDLGDERLEKEKSYFTSRGLNKPIEIVDNEQIKRLLYEEGVGSRETYSSEFENEHTGKIRYSQYNLNREGSKS